MRTLTLVVSLFLLAAPAAAQEPTPLAELSGGYSLLNKNAESWNGWFAAGSVTVTRWFGVAAEVGANYWTERYTFEGREYAFDADTLFAGVGPRFVARSPRVSGFGQLLVGVENEFEENLFAFQAGGGVDVWLASRVGIRAGVDGRLSYYEEERYGSWRFHTGVVVALGTR